MRKFAAIVAVLALVVSAPALACGNKAAAAAGQQCPLGMKGVEKTATNLDNGVKLTVSSKDAEQVKTLQAAMAAEDKDGGCQCAMHAKGVQRAIQNTANGVVVTLTSSDREQVKTLQAFAADACKGDCPMKGHGAQAAEKGECPHAKQQADRT